VIPASSGPHVTSADPRRSAAAVTEYKQGFKTCYKAPDGEEHEHLFDSAIENNEFASGMGLMGVRSITKYWYSWAMQEWFRYHNNRKE